MAIDIFELSAYRHPSTPLFLERLQSIDFASRYDALCAAHPRRGNEVHIEARHAAIASSSRHFSYNKHNKYWAYREKEKYPKYCGLGLDVRIDARVELDLLFATPHGHLTGPFPRFVKQLRQVADPSFKHATQNPAPRIEKEADLPRVLADCLALYDLLADTLAREDWWAPSCIGPRTQAVDDVVALTEVEAA